MVVKRHRHAPLRVSTDGATRDRLPRGPVRPPDVRVHNIQFYHTVEKGAYDCCGARVFFCIKKNTPGWPYNHHL